jgi:hypothetical protein
MPPHCECAIHLSGQLRVVVEGMYPRAEVGLGRTSGGNGEIQYLHCAVKIAVSFEMT